MLILVKESLPRWYGLSWRSEDPALVLSIHEDFLAANRKYLARDSEIERFRGDLGLGSFNRSFETGFGFDDTLVREEPSASGFLTFVGRLPRIKRALDTPCSACRGTGRDESLDIVCLRCGGEKKDVKFDHKPGFALSASLGLFLRTAYFCDVPTSAVCPQLLTVQLSSEHGMNGSSLGGMYSIELVRWLSSQPLQENLDFMSRAARTAYDHMVGASEYEERKFWAHVAGKNGHLNVSCPGNACGLAPSYHGIEPERGYEFDSHNVDSPAQQLTILAGLAALHDEVDKSL